MTTSGILQIVFYFLLLLVLTPPLGRWCAKIMEGERTWLHRFFAPLERNIYRLIGTDPGRQMGWKQYTLSLLSFSFVGFTFVYALQRLQNLLPLNPEQLGAVSPDSSFNTAVSFVTNTNWQGYGGETTMSYLTQMAGLTVQNFISAAAGIAILAALIRGIRNSQNSGIGNFWADLTRASLYILLPLSIVCSLLLVSQGVPQTLRNHQTAELLDAGNEQSDQFIPLGPVASQVAIKQLGTNGGGYYNTNSAHPLENPTPLSNFVEMLSILLLPSALVYAFGLMVGDTKQAWAILAAMLIILVPLTFLCYGAETASPLSRQTVENADLAIDAVSSPTNPGGNMEGKELRFGVANSALWASATTAASNGSVNSMHDSFMPLGTLTPLFLMQLGEVVFGGVGSGLYGMLMFAIITVFVSGLMVGRTPEYLGKKVDPFEMKMAVLTVLVPCLFVLLGTAISVITPAGTATLGNPGVRGFSEVLYAFTSASNNNGSALAGLGANNVYYNTALGICMLAGRFWIAVPVLALAGSLAQKTRIPVTAGTLPTNTALFAFLLAAIVVIVGALTYVPALALGPIVEHLI